MNNPDEDLLQALEHAVEQVRRLAHLTRTLIEAMRRGETLMAERLDDYVSQLGAVEGEAAHMDELT